jgi:hypothetical protein
MNVWLDYFRTDDPTASPDTSALLEARARLRLATQRGLVRPILTHGVASELTGALEHVGHKNYCEMMIFAWEVSEGRFLAHEDDRGKQEILWGGKLTLERALVSHDDRRSYRDRCMLSEEWTRSHAATVAQAQDVSHAEEIAKARETVEQLDAKDAKEAAEAAEANDGRVLTPWRASIEGDDAAQKGNARDALIVDWALDEMVTIAMHAGVPFARDRLPDPRTLPSFYFAKLVHVVRILGVILEGRSPTNTDIYDLSALQDAAAYADVLVTSDGKLRKLAKRVQLPIRVIDYRAWDDELRALLR